MRTTKQMVEHLKAMGLAQPLRAKCLETYRDAGEAEAIEQAERYLTNERHQIESCRNVARSLFGLAI